MCHDGMYLNTISIAVIVSCFVVSFFTPMLSINQPVFATGSLDEAFIARP